MQLATHLGFRESVNESIILFPSFGQDSTHLSPLIYLGVFYCQQDKTHIE